MTQNAVFSRDESGVDAMMMRFRQNCDGYTCLDNGNVPLAMAYVAMQKYENLYTPSEGYNAGTLFKDLDKPFTGKRGVLQ